MQGASPGRRQQDWLDRLRELAATPVPGTSIPSGVVALLCAGLLGWLLLPFGPDVSSSQIEGSFRDALNAEGGPPASEGDGIKSLDCRRKWILNNASWTCELEREIALFPDASGVYDVDVDGDLCWTAVADEYLSDNETQVIGTEFDSCIQAD